MLNFGPCTITHNGASLGKTFGGVSLTLSTVEQNLIGRYGKDVIIVGGNGEASLYSWPTSITLNSTTTLLDYDEVILDGGDRFKVTLYDCKILMGDSLSLGTNDQKAFKVNLTFRADTSGNVIKIE